MLTMPQLYSRTDSRRKESANYVRIIYQKRGWRKEDGRGFVACKSYSTKEWDPYRQKYVPNPRIKNRYITVIVFLDQRLHVMADCSCADYRYRLDYSLHVKRASDLEYAQPGPNGLYPKIRNPSLKAYACKHLVKLWETILPEIPKIPRNAKSDDTYAPKVRVTIPNSILRKQQEEKMTKEQKNQQKQSKPFVPPKNAPAPKTKGLQSPGMSNWIFGG
jgi:hypothetical protein